MPQLPLFDGSDQLTVTPLARKTDPATSHEAAREHKESGRAAKSAAAVLAAVNRFPGSTAVELASKAGLDRYEVSRRLADLYRHMIVRHGKVRECTINGRKMMTWLVN